MRRRVTEIEAMYERPRVNVKVERGLSLRLRVTSHTLSLFYFIYGAAKNLRAYARTNNATVEIHL